MVKINGGVINEKSWQYKLRNFTSVKIGSFEKYFENMPYDPYVRVILECEDFHLLEKMI